MPPRRRPCHAHRALGYPEAHRGGGALPGGGRVRVRDRGYGPPPGHGPCRRAAGGVRAGAHRDSRAMGPDAQPNHRARSGAPHDSLVREHASPGRARCPPHVGTARRHGGRRAPRQHVEGGAVRRRAAAEGRRRGGLCCHGVPGAWHRRRRRRPRLPDRLAAQHRRRPPARGPVGPLARRNAEGPLLPAHARRHGRDGRIAQRRPRGRARRAQHPPLAPGRVGPADGRRLRERGVVRGRPLRHGAPGLSLRRAAAGEVRPGRRHAVGGGRQPLGTGRRLSPPRRREPAGQGYGGAPGSPP